MVAEQPLVVQRLVGRIGRIFEKEGAHDGRSLLAALPEGGEDIQNKKGEKNTIMYFLCNFALQNKKLLIKWTPFLKLIKII